MYICYDLYIINIKLKYFNPKKLSFENKKNYVEGDKYSKLNKKDGFMIFKLEWFRKIIN